MYAVIRSGGKQERVAEGQRVRVELLGQPIGAEVSLEPVLVVEDVVTRGGRVVECIEIVRRAGGAVAGVAMLVDRSAGSAHFDVPSVSLLELSFPTYPADRVPQALSLIPVEKPGS